MSTQLRGGRLGAIFIDSALQPLRQLLETLVELNLRAVTQNILRLRNVAKAVADIPGAIVAGYIGFQMLLAQHHAQSPGDLEDRVRLAATEVENLVRGRRAIQRQNTSGSEVAHV